MICHVQGCGKASIGRIPGPDLHHVCQTHHDEMFPKAGAVAPVEAPWVAPPMPPVEETNADARERQTVMDASSSTGTEGTAMPPPKSKK